MSSRREEKMLYIGKIITLKVDKDTKVILIIHENDEDCTILLERKNRIYEYTEEDPISRNNSLDMYDLWITIANDEVMLETLKQQPLHQITLIDKKTYH